MASPPLLLLDANTLLLLFVGRFKRSLVPEFKRTQAFAVEDFDLLLKVVRTFRTLVTTPHILAEVSNLSRQLPGGESHRLAYFATFANDLQQLDERYLPATALANHQTFARLGLTDAGIAEIAERDNLRVLTTDLDLYLWLSKNRVRAVNFNHIRQWADADDVASMFDG